MSGVFADDANENGWILTELISIVDLERDAVFQVLANPTQKSSSKTTQVS